MRALIAIITLLISSVALAEAPVLPVSFAPSPELSKWIAPLGKDWFRDYADDRWDRWGEGSEEVFVSVSVSSGNGSGMVVFKKSHWDAAAEEVSRHRRDEWTRKDTYLEALYLGFIVIDYYQTGEIVDHPDKWHELDPLLPQHPTRKQIAVASLIHGTGHFLIAYNLPSDWRTGFQVGTSALYFGVVAHNYHIGIRGEF